MSELFPLLFFALLVLSIALVKMYNNFIKYRNILQEEWSDIDTALKRRFNLIPGLVEAVKHYTRYESDTLAGIVERRGARDVAVRSSEESAISQSLGGLIAVAEDYPELKASQNFTVLQEALVEVEEEIQQMRRSYNGAVRKYNIHVESFPSNLMAHLFGFIKAEYFALELVTQREVPEMGFEDKS